MLQQDSSNVAEYSSSVKYLLFVLSLFLWGGLEGEETELGDMLLRSNSTPMLKSCIHQTTLEPDLGIRSPAARSLSVSSLSSPSKIPRTSSDSNLNRMQISISKKKRNLSPFLVRGAEMDLCSETFLFFLREGAECTVAAEQEKKVMVLGTAGGGDVSDGGGASGSYFGGGGDEDGFGNSGQGSESMDGYYQKMIQQYPDDALLLGNYARFLKEVRGEAVKAEEYCERAILAKGSDGNVLSMYGDLIWENHKDGGRAQSYFDQAVQSSPDDCHVLASYAHFLWDVEDEDEVDEESGICSSDLSQGCAPPLTIPPLTGAA